jgi:hypothetical protein
MNDTANRFRRIVSWLAAVACLTGALRWFVEITLETLTERLGRYHRHESPDSYRYRVAHFLCQRVLDPFDPTGDHC